MSIIREIEVTRKGLARPIDVTYGTNMLQIEFVVTDFILPEGATSQVFAMDGNKNVKSQPCTVSGNKISFEPKVGLFEEGKNILQLAVSYNGKNLFTFYQPVTCHYTMQFEGAQDLENDPTFKGMVMQMQQEIAEISRTIDDLNSLQANGISQTAIHLLITVLKSCFTQSDQTSNIDALEVALKRGSTGGEDVTGVTQTGTILTIVSGVTATQTGSTLAIA